METPAGGGCGHLPRLATCLVDCTLRDMHTMYLALTTLQQRHFAPLRGLSNYFWNNGNWPAFQGH
eukprot:CAMPEP_0183518212 /NCGR_PEP_ID=MMETSP0371-20130417/15371_1 /TAXON_ID=268820 /ORGANISM="Peridinium aciculiferum, Strain PAER-2" /LENGTH=64 /DNA_ID=CAMNT_0025716237 /DNA_START=333 /DNA_END=527 /DNA_ORIENTATION=+